MSVIVGWLVGANCADTLTVWGDKFVIGKNFWDPGIGILLQIGKTGYQKNSSETTHSAHSGGGGGDRPHRPPPYGSTTACNRGNVQVIVRKDHRMRLSFLHEQLVRSSEQLVLVDTKRGFLGADTNTPSHLTSPVINCLCCDSNSTYGTATITCRALASSADGIFS